jgi:hypothetical protein
LIQPLSYAESTSGLPKGARTILYRHIAAAVPGTFDGSSTFKSFRIQEKLDGARISAAFAPARDLIDQIRLIDQSSAEQIDFGSINLDPKINIQAEAFVLGWGITSDTSVFACLPFWRASVDFNGPVYSPTSSLQMVVKKLERKANKSHDPDRARILSRILARLPSITGENLQDILVNTYGYKPLGNWSGQGIGDSFFFIHQNLRKSRYHRSALRIGVALPTGRKDDPDNLVDVPFGDSVTGTYLEWLNDFSIIGKRLTASAGGKYQYNWSRNRTYRLIEDPSFPITSKKESLFYKPGDHWSMQSGFDLEVMRPLHVFTNLTHERHERDRIHGKLADYDYQLLMNNTQKESNTVEAGIKFSTVPWYRQKSASIPMDLTAATSRVVSGKNSEIVNIAYAELSVYF